MYALVYLVAAYSLLKYCFSPVHRTQCHQRWKQTPTHRVVFEVGGGIIGLFILAAILAVILASWTK